MNHARIWIFPTTLLLLSVTPLRAEVTVTGTLTQPLTFAPTSGKAVTLPSGESILMRLTDPSLRAPTRIRFEGADASYEVPIPESVNPASPNEIEIPVPNLRQSLSIRIKRSAAQDRQVPFRDAEGHCKWRLERVSIYQLSFTPTASRTATLFRGYGINPVSEASANDEVCDRPPTAPIGTSDLYRNLADESPAQGAR